MGTIYHLTTALIGIAILVPAAAIVLLYGALVRIATWAGWNTLLLTGTIAAWALERVLVGIFGDWAGHDIFIIALVILAGLALWQRLTRLVKGTLCRQDLSH